MEINFEFSSKRIAPISVFRPAQPLPVSSPSSSAVLLLLRFSVNIQWTFRPRPPEMMDTVNAGISERLSAARSERKVISGAPFLPDRRAYCPRPLASQGLLARQFQGLAIRLLWREMLRKLVPPDCVRGAADCSTLCFWCVAEEIKPRGTSAHCVALWSLWLFLKNSPVLYTFCCMRVCVCVCWVVLPWVL